MRAVTQATAVAGSGLDGDRYATGLGHWSPIRRSGDGLTLIEAEEVEAAAGACGVELPPGATRRNLTTRGIRLNDLVGRSFRIGSVECRGIRLCEPCSYLDGFLGQSLLPVPVHRAGIRIEVVTGGTIVVGHPIEPLGD